MKKKAEKFYTDQPAKRPFSLVRGDGFANAARGKSFQDRLDEQERMNGYRQIIRDWLKETP